MQQADLSDFRRRLLEKADQTHGAAGDVFVPGALRAAQYAGDGKDKKKRKKQQQGQEALEAGGDLGADEKHEVGAKGTRQQWC